MHDFITLHTERTRPDGTRDLTGCAWFFIHANDIAAVQIILGDQSTPAGIILYGLGGGPDQFNYGGHLCLRGKAAADFLLHFQPQMYSPDRTLRPGITADRLDAALKDDPNAEAWPNGYTLAWDDQGKPTMTTERPFIWMEHGQFAYRHDQLSSLSFDQPTIPTPKGTHYDYPAVLLHFGPLVSGRQALRLPWREASTFLTCYNFLPPDSGETRPGEETANKMRQTFDALVRRAGQPLPPTPPTVAT